MSSYLYALDSLFLISRKNGMALSGSSSFSGLLSEHSMAIGTRTTLGVALCVGSSFSGHLYGYSLAIGVRTTLERDRFFFIIVSLVYAVELTTKIYNFLLILDGIA